MDKVFKGPYSLTEMLTEFGVDTTDKEARNKALYELKLAKRFMRKMQYSEPHISKKKKAVYFILPTQEEMFKHES